jgi:hypothetical protein
MRDHHIAWWNLENLAPLGAVPDSVQVLTSRSR